MATQLASPPVVRGTVEQQYIIEPLRGARDIVNLLERFPEEIYNKGADSHLVRFMQALLGNQGVNRIRQNYLEARIILEELGIELFDLDSFFGDPIGFGRIVEETYQRDPEGLIPKEDWDRIKAKDAKYRSRSIDYFSGARLGNTPEGMRLVSRAGLGHEVEIIENYRWLFDQHSDDQLGLDYFGKTLSAEEMIVLPRRELPRSEIQRVVLTATSDVPDGGSFQFVFNGSYSLPVPIGDWHIPTRDDIRLALEAIPSIGIGGVNVSGPNASEGGHTWTWDITFSGNLSATDVPPLTILNGLTTSNPEASIEFSIETVTNGSSGADEVVTISPRDLAHHQFALDRIKSVTTIPTIGEAPGLREQRLWNQVHATSTYTEVIRYVTGNSQILWPKPTDKDPFHWIERDQEHEGPRFRTGLDYHYQGFHNVQKVRTYTESALASTSAYKADVSYSEGFASNHIGRFNPAQIAAYPFLDGTGDDALFPADKVLADYAEPLGSKDSLEEVRTGEVSTVLRRIYPADYVDLPGAPPVRYKDEQFWASLERSEGSEYIEIDLGQVEAVNYLCFEISDKPVKIAVTYDTLDQLPRRSFKAVTPAKPFTEYIFSGAVNASPNTISTSNPWQPVELAFSNRLGEIIFTRHIRIELQRLITSDFLYDPVNRLQNPWSIEVRNLRIARNIS